MLFNNPRKLLVEAASADLLNPEVSEEVKDVIEELEEDLTNNVEEVDEKDKTTNGGVPVVSEAVNLYAAQAPVGTAKYFVSLETVIAIQETEGEMAAAEQNANAEEGAAPATAEECEPDATNVVEDIAAKNGVEPEQVAVVITAESVKLLVENTLLEAKCGKKDGKNAKKLKKTKKAVDQLKNKVNLVRA